MSCRAWSPASNSSWRMALMVLCLLTGFMPSKESETTTTEKWDSLPWVFAFPSCIPL